jgi:hypothetical protein
VIRNVQPVFIPGKTKSPLQLLSCWLTWRMGDLKRSATCKHFPGTLRRTPMTKLVTDLTSDIRGEPRSSSNLSTNQPCWLVRDLWSQCLLLICRAYCAWEQEDRFVSSWWMQFPGFTMSCSWTNWSPFRLRWEDGFHRCQWPENLVAPAFLQVTSRELLFNSHGKVWACRTCHYYTLGVTNSCPSPSYRQLREKKSSSKMLCRDRYFIRCNNHCFWTLIYGG